MCTVRSILKSKSNVIYSVAPDCIVYDALEIMFEKNISALLVMQDEKLVGIFTERDYARKVVLKGKASKEIKVEELMTSNLITISIDSNIEDCMKLMTNKFIRHLPVLEDGELVGFISIGDVVKNIIDEQKFIIKNLEHYITH